MICRTCGNSHQENFCPNCGEKKFNKANLSIRHFLGETFESLIHFDGKFFRSLKMLITRPGQLTIEYVDGRRTPYMRPVQLFVVINLLFFFFVTPNPYSLAFRNYYTISEFTRYHTREKVDEKLKETGMTLHAYELYFNEKMNAESKEFVFLFVPFYGLLFALLFCWQKRQFVEYLVFATHFCAAILIYFTVLIYAVYRPFAFFANESGFSVFEKIMAQVTLGVIVAYLIVAIRRFFRPPILWTLISSGLIAWSFWACIHYYRILLFYKIIYL